MNDLTGLWIGEKTISIQEILQLHPEMRCRFMWVQSRPWNPDLLTAKATSSAFK
jgi:hypothetical protein